MNSTKLSSLAAAVILAMPSITYADVLARENERADGFIEGSTLDAKLRNAYFDRDYKRGIHDSDTWAQSIELNYRSGYIADILGFDASYYGAFPLDGDVSHGNNPGLLPSDSGGDLTGFSKVGQAFVKAKYGDEDLGLYSEIGRMKIDNVLVASSGSRLTPSTFQGGLLDFYVNGAKLQYIRLDKMSRRNQSAFDSFEGANGNIDYVESFAGWYSLGNTNFSAEYVKSDDYLDISYYNINHKFELAQDTSLVIDGQYYRAKEDGNQWSGSDDSNGHSYDANIYGLAAVLNHDAWEFTAGYTYSSIEGDVNGSDGSVFWYQISDQDHGGGNLYTMAGVSDFAYGGERAYTLGASYDFGERGLPGLSAGTQMYYGDNISYNGKNNLSEKEIDYFVRYEFQHEDLKGLSIEWNLYDYRADDRELNYYASGGRLRENRIYLDYTLPLM